MHVSLRIADPIAGLLALTLSTRSQLWHDVDRRNIHSSVRVGAAYLPYGSLIAWLTCGVSTVLMELVTEKALISNLQQRISLNKDLKRPGVLSKKDVRNLRRRRKHWNS
jgi:hypothetical protein